ncbi:MAG: protein kinase [Myxococcota bacterium]
MQLPAPFGKYELLERIATGGMAEVFLARSFGLAGFEKRCVVKRLRQELADDPRFVQMFINEAKLGVQLNHPNIVQVYELGKVGTAHYMAMEHLHGRDLTRITRRLRSTDDHIEVPVAVGIMAEMCRGLAYAHARTTTDGTPLGLVHRDVSPHNVLVTFAGEVKLVDFGIARLMNTVEGGANPKSGPGGGKYAYMSPEQARGDVIDHRSDLFSAGIVLWEMLVGRRLFHDTDPEVKLERVRNADVVHPGQLGVAVDDDLWAILERALAAEREDRYPNAEQLEEDLRAWLFEQRTPVGRAGIATIVREAFPDEAGSSDGLQLKQLLADVDRLDPTHRTEAPDPDPSETSGVTTLPGRLTAPVGQRRSVVVVMIDVDGLTELSTRVSPETMVKRRYQLLRWVRRIADLHHGYVQRAIDDQITLMFGVPRSRFDQVSHALACALHLQREVSHLRRKGMGLEFAIGVHTGEVTTHESSRRIRYVARGDTTRLARRLSAVADHGQVLVSERVLAQVKGEYRLRRGHDVPSRGDRDDLPSYVVEARTSGLRGSHEGTWIRRGNELETLRAALVALATGQSATMALVGGVGSGKSRFLREIRDLAARRRTLFVATRCSAVRERPLEPLRDLVESILGLDPEDSSERRLAAVDALHQWGIGSRNLDALRQLLGANGRRSVDRTLAWEALAALLRGLANERPVIVAIDEAQHLYPGGLRDLAQLLRSVQDVPVLVLVATRTKPEDLLGLCRMVPFEAFAPDLQVRFVEALLGVGHVEDRILKILARTCEGNPLYIEEMLKFLVSSERIVIEEGAARLTEAVADDELPHTLQALVTTRIDELEPAARGLLQLAAVVGREFHLPVLAEAAGLDPSPLIFDLLAHGLVVRESAEEWAFSSQLVHEAALRGTLGVQRRDYHRLIASALESLYADRLEPHYEALMNHCAEGGRPLDAARYAFRAGEELEKKQFLDRARLVFQTGLEHLARTERNPDDWDARVQGEALLDLHLGQVQLLLGELPKGRQRLQLALDIASEAGMPWIESRAHIALARTYIQQSRWLLAKAHLSQAQTSLRIEDDPEVAREAAELTAVLAFEQGEHEAAEQLWSEALALSKDDPASMARCQIGLANRHLHRGDYSRGREWLQAALATSRQAEDRILEGRVLNNLGLVQSWSGNLDEALQYYRAALHVREGVGYTRGVIINHHNIGDVHFQKHDYSRARVSFDRSRELARTLGWDRGMVLNDIFLAYLGAQAGEHGVEPILEAVDRARSLGDAEVMTAGEWLAGRWLLENNRVREGRSQLELALEDAEQNDLQSMVDLISERLKTLPLTK